MQAPPQHIDIFCRVIDNYGDIGVCWRLAAELAERGHHVRLWADDSTALRWMAPHGHPHVHVQPFEQARLAPTNPGPHSNAPWPHIVIEAFGCEAPGPYLHAMRSAAPAPLLINLEYLSAEGYVQRCHRLPSPITTGPGAGLTRWFFYPGFTPGTGGLLREHNLLPRQRDFCPHQWRSRHAIAPATLVASLFCYEPPALRAWLAQLAQPTSPPLQLLITPGRAHAAVHALPQHIAALPRPPIQLSQCSQTQFDEMLWASDLNLVRGEDSLVRALWAGQPLIWQLYPQHDHAHHAKLHAFLDWLDAPPSLRTFHHAWNGLPPPNTLPTLSTTTLHEWRECVQAARKRLLAQDDLITQLLTFAQTQPHTPAP